MERREFVLANDNQKIFHRHKCKECDLIIYNVFECKERCSVYCYDHLPENKKCGECGSNFELNSSLTERIKQKYEIKCSNCSQKMFLIQLESHLKDGNCKKQISLNKKFNDLKNKKRNEEKLIYLEPQTNQLRDGKKKRKRNQANQNFREKVDNFFFFFFFFFF